jgi:hypothetical protein
MMTTLYMVRSNPVEGKEDEFNRWYSDVHLPEVLQIEGFYNAQRFCLTPQQLQPQAHRYLAIYAINGDDIDGTLENLRNMRSFNMSDALDMSSIEISIFGQI